MGEVKTVPIKYLPLHQIYQIYEFGTDMTSVYEYLNPTSDELILYIIEPSLVDLRKLLTKETSTSYERYPEDIPSRNS